MKKFNIVILLLIVVSSLQAQERLTKTEKLATTAKVWGFLKYYHPKVAKGNFNWDKQLFDVLEKIKEVDTRKGQSKVYLDWISTLGKVNKCRKCKRKSNLNYFNKNFDLSWIDDSVVFTPKLTRKLRYIEHNRHLGGSHYVKYENKRVGNLKFTTDDLYRHYDWHNENLRLLTLFRYWNIIEYFFPYKYQIDEPWDEVLKRMIPKFVNPKSKEDYYLAILELVASIDDSHAFFYSQATTRYFGYYWIPAKDKIIDGNAVITDLFNDSLARIDDLQVGDIITKVNGQYVDSIFNQRKKYICGSNLSVKKRNARTIIFNGLSKTLNIEFIRDEKTINKTIRRYLYKRFNYKPKTEKKFKILEGNIGYVNLGVLKRRDVSKMMRKLKDTKAIIFDIRNYPNETGYSISRYISSKRNVFYKNIVPDLDYPGKFIWEDGNKCGRNGKLKYKGKVILLVNDETQSHAEFVTMMLQTGDNVTTIGNQTAGADGNVDEFMIVGGYKTRISGIGIFYPDKTETQRKGVRIDIKVKPTISGIKNRRDEVLEKAIEFIDK